MLHNIHCALFLTVLHNFQKVGTNITLNLLFSPMSLQLVREKRLQPPAFLCCMHALWDQINVSICYFNHRYKLLLSLVIDTWR